MSDRFDEVPTPLPETGSPNTQSPEDGAAAANAEPKHQKIRATLGTNPSGGRKYVALILRGFPDPLALGSPETLTRWGSHRIRCSSKIPDQAPHGRDVKRDIRPRPPAD
jgi:hypothetical protein